MSKHTQGEWYVVPKMSKHDSYIAIASNCKQDRKWIAEAKSSHVNDGMGQEEFLANARLIAAAPDLLEALEYLINCSTKDRFKCELQDAIPKALLAIKKAKGE